MKREKRTIWEILFPQLTPARRGILYLVSLACIFLSFVQIILECFPEAVGIGLYVLSAVGLFYSCYYAGSNVKENIKERNAPAFLEHPYVQKLMREYRTRTIVLMMPGVFSNVVFAVFNAVVGITSHSAWFGTMAAYYMLLSAMRIGAVKKDRQVRRMEDDRKRRIEEIKEYRKNSILFLFMAVVLGGAVVVLECSAGGKHYPGLTIYAAAAYSFYKIIMSTIQVIKVKKRNSPLLAIIRRIGFIDASVSILTLQTAMFASFASGMEEAQIRIMNGITGSVVCLLVLFGGIQGIRQAGRMRED